MLGIPPEGGLSKKWHWRSQSREEWQLSRSPGTRVCEGAPIPVHQLRLICAKVIVHYRIYLMFQNVTTMPYNVNCSNWENPDIAG